MECLFCEKRDIRTEFIYENESVFVLYDQYPVNKGHCLIIPKRHIVEYFDLERDELLDVDEAIRHMKDILSAKYQPDGYNIGVNNGKAAGQTIMHLHIHLIPRYEGDCLNPRGGVRGVIPDKQNYDT